MVCISGCVLQDFCEKQSLAAFSGGIVKMLIVLLQWFWEVWRTLFCQKNVVGMPYFWTMHVLHVLEELSHCPSPTSASPAPTGQSEIAGSGNNGNYNYAIHIRRLKTPGCAAGMLRALFQLSGADNFFMVCYGRPSLVLSHAQASTTLHCISARISDSWASQPNKPNVHCQFEFNNLY